jgi:hypothetical protein
MRPVRLFTAILLLLQSLLTSATATDGPDEPDSAEQSSHLHRNLILGNLIVGSAAYVYLSNTWGTPDGKFHLKRDIDDNLAMTDEISHAFVSYRLTQGCAWLFRVFKMPESKVEKYSIIEAALVTTLVEFPLDAYNPDQGFGVSDLIFNWIGISFAYFKQHGLESFDLKFAVKRSPLEFDNKLLANKNAEFDNFVWWATWKPKYLWLGLGYSTNHSRPGGLVESEYYLGVGTTLYDVLNLVDGTWADRLKVLDTYFLNIHVRL